MAESHHPSQNTPTQPTHINNLAVISLVAGILTWLLIPILGAIIAIVTGHMAKRDIRESQGNLGGNGMATAGLVLGYIQLIVVVISICIITVLILLTPAIGDVFFNIAESISAP